MNSNGSDPDQVRLIEKWRLRHAYPDAVGMWAISTAPEAYGYAFNAIAQDPRILHRAARPQANRMAVQAEDFALSVARSDAAKSDTWRAAALFVQHSIDTWRRSLRTYNPRSDSLSVSATSIITRTHLQDPWEIARRNFPHIDDDTGRLATRIVREFGTTALGRVRKPWDHVIVLAVLRFAARQFRGEATEDGAGIDDVLAVQSYAENNGLAPMLVPYSGPGKPAQQALALVRDADTLREVVCAASSDMRASIWQRALDLHAFALVALDHRMLLDLPLDEAHHLATAAIRHADAIIGAPDTVARPLLPWGRAIAPQVVALHARACLPDRS